MITTRVELPHFRASLHAIVDRPDFNTESAENCIGRNLHTCKDYCDCDRVTTTYADYRGSPPLLMHKVVIFFIGGQIS